MTDDVRTFVRACTHCLSTFGSERIPRPFGPAVHGTKSKDLVQFDYNDLGPSNSGEKYVLMLRDDDSDYKRFVCSPNTDLDNTAHVIIDWCATNGVPGGLMCDGPTYFNNGTVHRVSKGLKTPHHSTLPYCLWSNGAAERIGRELLRVLSSLITESQMDRNEWPDLVLIVQSVLNHPVSPRRGNVCAITSFMGRHSTSSVLTFLRFATTTPVFLTEAHLKSALNVKALVELCSDLHPRIQSTLAKHREQKRVATSKGQLPNFTEGDYVLVARSDFHGGEKLCIRSRGPRQVPKALSDYAYQVEDLRNGQLDDVHASRLKLLGDSKLNNVAVMSHVLQSDTGVDVSRVLGLEDGPNGHHTRIRWKGLGEVGDILASIARVYEDAPQLFDKLLKRNSTPVDLATWARDDLDL